jgi:hypothetical protein
VNNDNHDVGQRCWNGMWQHRSVFDQALGHPLHVDCFPHNIAMTAGQPATDLQQTIDSHRRAWHKGTKSNSLFTSPLRLFTAFPWRGAFVWVVDYLGVFLCSLRKPDQQLDASITLYVPGWALGANTHISHQRESQIHWIMHPNASMPDVALSASQTLPPPPSAHEYPATQERIALPMANGNAWKRDASLCSNLTIAHFFYARSTASREGYLPSRTICVLTMVRSLSSLFSARGVKQRYLPLSVCGHELPQKQGRSTLCKCYRTCTSTPQSQGTSTKHHSESPDSRSL